MIRRHIIADDSALAPSHQRLVDMAENFLREHFRRNYHHVICAILTKEGQVCYGLHIDCDGFDACAEPSALSSVFVMSKTPLASVTVTLSKNSTTEIINPCGNCLHYFIRHAPDIQIIATINGHIRLASVKVLMPYPYVHTSNERS